MTRPLGELCISFHPYPFTLLPEELHLKTAKLDSMSLSRDLIWFVDVTGVIVKLKDKQYNDQNEKIKKE
jgi:hypothetical protein